MLNKSLVTKHVVMIVYPDAQVLDITGPTEVFSMANDYMQRHQPSVAQPYNIQWWAKLPGTVAMSSGLELMINHGYTKNRKAIDTLLVPGGRGLWEAMADDELIDFINRRAASVRRTVSICTGTFLLAKAKLLNGKRVTTHWNWGQKLQQDFPEIQVDSEALYINQGVIYTSAGVTAGIDLALSLVEEDLGREVASYIAKRLVVFLRRPGNQTQFSNVLERQSLLTDDFSGFHNWLLENIETSITVESMAQHCSLSPRHFARRFSEQMKITPAKYLESLRVEQARLLMENGQQSLKSVAYACGFSSIEQLRRSFTRLLSVTPSDYQSRF